jgi:hypothetical protein
VTVEQAGIGRSDIAYPQVNDVAGHQILRRQQLPVPVA